MKQHLSILCLALFLLFAGCVTSPKATKVATAMTIRHLELPAAPGSGEPNLCVSPRNALYISWIEPTGGNRHVLRFAKYAAGSATWLAPQTIAEGENWFVNWADFPSLAVGLDGNLTAHWLARSGKSTYAYSVYVSHSSDGGQTWSQPRTLHDDGTQTEHGFVSLVSMNESGSLLAAWLDGRKFAQDTEEMTLRSRLLRPDGSWGPETLVDELVCDCCQTSAVRLPGGKALVVYRDRSKEEIRDISAVRFENGAWSHPISVHADGWRMPGCPVNGPSVDAQDEQVVVAWFTGAQDTAQVQVAFSGDGGRSFGTPIRIDQGKPIGRVDTVMLDDHSALVSWVEVTGERNQAALFLQRASPQGAQGEPIRVEGTTASRASGFPRMARTGSEIVLAWTETSDPSRVRTAVAKLP